jgi:hypothetical protein
MGGEQAGKNSVALRRDGGREDTDALRRESPADTSISETIPIDSIFYYLNYSLEYSVTFS